MGGDTGPGRQGRLLGPRRIASRVDPRGSTARAHESSLSISAQRDGAFAQSVVAPKRFLRPADRYTREDPRVRLELGVIAAFDHEGARRIAAQRDGGPEFRIGFPGPLADRVTATNLPHVHV